MFACHCISFSEKCLFKFICCESPSLYYCSLFLSKTIMIMQASSFTHDWLLAPSPAPLSFLEDGGAVAQTFALLIMT